MKSLIDKALLSNQAEHDRTYEGMSMGVTTAVMECDRAVWYQYHKSIRKVFPARILRLFEFGHIIEPYLGKLLNDAGIETYLHDENGDQFLMSDHPLKGYCDGLSSDYVIEFKTHNDRSFKDVESKGVEKSKPEHYNQCQIYMHYFKKNQALYFAYNKNDSDIYIEVIEYNKSKAEFLILRAKTIATSKELPQRIASTPDFFKCRFCDYHGLCWSVEFAAVKCFTCVNCQPPDWKCKLYNVTPPAEVRNKGCENHLFNPELMPLEVQQIEKDYITYKYNAKPFYNLTLTGFPAFKEKTDYIYKSTDLEKIKMLKNIDSVENVKNVLGGEIE